MTRERTPDRHGRMNVRIAFFVVLLCFSFTSRAGAEEGTSTRPALFENIRTLPAHEQDLVPHFIVNHDGDGEGEEMPSSILYSRKDTKEFGTSMTITDTHLCIRPVEKDICRSFAKMISAPPPALGTDITATRIGGAGYTTVFLVQVGPVKFDGVDSLTAFLGADSQDPPFSEIVLYIYAKKGTNLIQLHTRVGRCNVIADPPLDDLSYYTRFCISEKIIADAKSRAKELTELFALKTSGPALSESAPERVTFKKGTSGAALKGRIYGYDYKDYVIAAGKDQLMTLRLSSRNMYTVFRIISINGRPDEKLMRSEGSDFSGTLPETGDYVVRVLMMRTGARKKDAVADYSLKVSLQ